jgi:hypothetical protein
MSFQRASWKVKDQAILRELVSLMEVSEEETQLLASVRNQAHAAAPLMLDAFYGRLINHEYTAEYLEGASMERLHAMVTEWFVDLFCGKYDDAYAGKRLHIGHVHMLIGLPVRYPLAMLDVVMPFGEEVARQSAKPNEAVKAFRKVLALDIAIFNQAYADIQLRHLSELIGGEGLARLLMSGKV